MPDARRGQHRPSHRAGLGKFASCPLEARSIFRQSYGATQTRSSGSPTSSGTDEATVRASPRVSELIPDAPLTRLRCSRKSGKPCRVAATEGGLCFFHASANKASDLGRVGKGRKVIRPGATRVSIHHLLRKWCMIISMGRTNIDIDESLIRQARKLTRLKTKRQIVDRALDLLVRSESRKGILRYYGAGIWKGDLKASRRNRS